MPSRDHGANPQASRKPSFFSHYLFSTDHKTVGLQYLWLAFASVFVGMVISAVLRIHASWPGSAIPFLSGLAEGPDRFAALRLLHGSLMIFFVLTAAPQLGFGNYLLPLQIGANEMAFPTLNRLCFWMTFASLAGITASFLLPLNSGITIWLLSASLFSLAALFSAINFTITTIELRTRGMDLRRMPATVWAWFINAILSLLVFSVLLAGSCSILSDRLLGSHFFSAAPFLAVQPSNLIRQGSLAILWQRLFWYFAQAQVYVAMLPCFGIATHILSTFARKPVWRERLVVLALCGAGVAGFSVWGYHMFATGMNPFEPLRFSVLASSLGIPAAILLASWLGTLWNARFSLSTAMLFAIGFISLFVAGGLSGIFLVRHELRSSAVTEDFVIGHFHLVMGVAATFAMLAGLFFWFPKLFGCRLNETLGKLHFWMTFAGVYSIFMPLHWLGLLTQSNLLSVAQRVALASGTSALRDWVAIATVCTVVAQMLFLVNLLGTLLRHRFWDATADESNPWRATTLEWSVASPAPENNFGSTRPIVYRGAYEFHPGFASDCLPQHLSPERLVEKVL